MTNAPEVSGNRFTRIPQGILMKIDTHKPPSARRDLSRPALNAPFNICEEWCITSDKAHTLRGRPPVSTYYRWKRDRTGGANPRGLGANQLLYWHLQRRPHPVRGADAGGRMDQASQYGSHVRRWQRPGPHDGRAGRRPRCRTQVLGHPARLGLTPFASRAV